MGTVERGDRVRQQAPVTLDQRQHGPHRVDSGPRDMSCYQIQHDPQHALIEVAEIGDQPRGFQHPCKELDLPVDGKGAVLDRSVGDQDVDLAGIDCREGHGLGADNFEAEVSVAELLEIRLVKVGLDAADWLSTQSNGRFEICIISVLHVDGPAAERVGRREAVYMTAPNPARRHWRHPLISRWERERTVWRPEAGVQDRAATLLADDPRTRIAI